MVVGETELEDVIRHYDVAITCTYPAHRIQ